MQQRVGAREGHLLAEVPLDHRADLRPAEDGAVVGGPARQALVQPAAGLLLLLVGEPLGPAGAWAFAQAGDTRVVEASDPLLDGASPHAQDAGDVGRVPGAPAARPASGSAGERPSHA